MIVQISPIKKLKGSIVLPASKSYSIRAFIIAACGGASTIIAPSDCDDAVVACQTTKALGCRVKKMAGNIWSVKAPLQRKISKNIFVRESGTTLRFILPLAALFSDQVTITGEKTLVGRPNVFLNQTLRKMGIKIKGAGMKESVPIKITGGKLKGGNIAIDGSMSSQFISALLITCPLLKENTLLRLTGHKIVSRDYVTMTLSILEKAKVQVKQKSDREFWIKGDQEYKGLRSFTVPSDYGLAAFLLGAAAIIDSDVLFKGYLNDKLIQADGHILSFLQKMGVKFHKTASSIRIKGPFRLKGGDFSLKDCPDLVPIMSVLALFAKGKTRLLDIKHARIKESDRISDLRKELLKIGADVRETPDSLTIIPQDHYKEGMMMDPHRDHRLAMAFAVIGLRQKVAVHNFECTHKSYPAFLRDLRALGADVKTL